jgi:L-ascorbate metabolism protein UlaG (beta-lactamase superfamily)
MTFRRRRAPGCLWRACVLGVASLLALALVGYVSTEQLRSFGAAPQGETLARIRASPEFHGDRFENAEPTVLMAPGSSGASIWHWLTGDEMRRPSCTLPLVKTSRAQLAQPPASGLRIMWLGHSTSLIELDGARILTDPQWSERASPTQLAGPKRFHPPPLAIAALPPLDAIVISHEHFDHLDMASVRALARHDARAVFHVPLGIGSHLEAWGIARARIVEHDYWQEAMLAHGVRVISTPARHFNGRGVPGRIGALWTSWSIVGPQHRVFFSGDTGPTRAFAEIARRAGPFDVAMLEIGQYHPSWGSIHLGPDGALRAHRELGAKALLPIHWATFELAYHAWSEPAETLSRAADKAGIVLLTPRLGQPIEPATAGATSRWWRALPPLAAHCAAY